ncbi:MAG: hypothetical protein LBU32_22115 [Clostridiales bacterium]|jgi:hypothetical protein|nr:hypothetical protein [Clostridiales bacterium]
MVNALITSARLKEPNFARFRTAALIACLIAGLAAGAVQALILPEARFADIKIQLDAQFSGTLNRSDLFVGAVLKNGGSMLLIWLLAFAPLGEAAAAAVLFVRAMGYGFTLLVLRMANSGSRTIYPLSNLSIQGLMLLGAHFFLCLLNASFRKELKDGNLDFRQITEYVLILLTALASAVLAAMLQR